MMNKYSQRDARVSSHVFFVLVVAVLSAAASAQPVFTARDISTKTPGARSVFPADMDGDGDTDVLAASGFDRTIRWYENVGNKGFITHDIFTFTFDVPTSVFAADVDGDGDTDVLSASSTFDGAIRWYENDGNQGFTAHDIFTIDGGAESVFAADVDGDGDTDVLSASFSDNAIRWYENDGNQGFTGHDIFTNALGALQVFAADVDGDGDTDVLSASRFDNAIRWYENDGNSGFIPHDISTTADNARSVFAADIDGDGDIDVLSASTHDFAVRWYENDGNQGFTAHDIFTNALGARSVFAADVDGDGDTDVLSASGDDASIRWYENDGSQVFTARNIFTNAIGVQNVFAADIDGDGDTDVHSSTLWYENGSDSTVWNTTTGVTSPTIPNAISLASPGDRLVTGPVRFESDLSIDFDGTGLELLGIGPINQPAGGRITLADNALLGNPDTPERTLELGATEIVLAKGLSDQETVFAGTLDIPAGDRADLETHALTVELYGTIELGVSSALLAGSLERADIMGNLELMEGSAFVFPGDLTLQAFIPRFPANDIFTNVRRARSVFAVDLDGDGDTDVLSNEEFDPAILWYENDGNQGFTVRVVASFVCDVRSVFAADVDGDGDTDVLSASTLGNAIRWYENDGNQSFTDHDIFRDSSTDAFDPISVFATDVDGDGDTDVLSASSYDDTVRWHKNDGNQNFTAHDISTNVDGARSVFATDVDGDGDTDVLSASANDDAVRWYENDGNQGFTAHDISTNANGASSVVTADVDGDGDSDVLSASANDDAVRWYENDGNHSFTAHDISTTADGATSVFASDVDGDGDTDVLAASFADDAVRWYENDGNQGFTAHDIFTNADGASSVFAADVDGDGDTDVLSASFHDETIRWYENNMNQMLVVHLPSGALLSAGGTITNDRVLKLDGGTIVAEGGFTNLGTLTGDGEIVADTINTGSVELFAASMIEGDYTNEGATTIQNGTFAVLGALTNRASATLRSTDSGAVAVGGDSDNAIDSNTRFDLASAGLTLNGFDGTQSLEAMSLDIGADPAGLDRTIAGHYPIGTLRIGPTSTTVSLVDAHDNANNGQASCEAVYANDLIIDKGATLNTNGCHVYYGTLTLDGAVDNPANLIPLESVTICTGDCDDSGAVDFNDLVSMLFEFGNTGDLSCNADGIGAVTFNDLVTALFLFGPCP